MIDLRRRSGLTGSRAAPAGHRPALLPSYRPQPAPLEGRTTAAVALFRGPPPRWAT